jgi:hypothetical protein
MSHLPKSKSLLFYVGVISSVLVLFQVVTAYGETHLKAPPNLNGRYLSASAPPGCPESDRLMLTLQQSGIYVNGFVTLESANASQNTQSSEATSEKKFSLTGLWKQEQLNLSGETDALTVCTIGGLASATAIALQGQVTSTSFTGQLTHGSQSGNLQPWQFTAQRQAPVKSETGH